MPARPGASWYDEAGTCRDVMYRPVTVWSWQIRISVLIFRKQGRRICRCAERSLLHIHIPMYSIGNFSKRRVGNYNAPLCILQETSRKGREQCPPNSLRFGGRERRGGVGYASCSLVTADFQDNFQKTSWPNANRELELPRVFHLSCALSITIFYGYPGRYPHQVFLRRA